LNITGRILSYSTEDHIMDAGGIIYEFDLDDNLAAKIEGAETTEYNYSSTGELMSVVLPDGTAITYIHDPNGRRIAKLVNGTIVEKYLWSGQTTLLAVYDGSDNLLQRFEYADGRMPVAMTASGSRYYLAYDQVGSLRLVTDSSGAVVKRIDYDTFGNILGDSNLGFAVPFGFAGGLHDRDTDLVRFGFRDYMSEIGRWTAKDPILFAGGDTNLYGYVGNDPVNFVDQDGLELLYADSATEKIMKPHVEKIRSTPKGKELIDKLEKKSWLGLGLISIDYTIHGAGPHGHPAYRQGNDVYIDPNFQPIIDTDCGKKVASTTRILAHELGHLTGTDDDGPDNMNNVNTWENPIMFLIDHFKRTKY
jgi:RHS repeat-associated protein